MERIKKNKKWYSILALSMVISFIAVLAWHHSVEAKYVTIENAGSTSFPNNNEYTYVKVTGPSGTSTMKEIHFPLYSMKNVSYQNNDIPEKLKLEVNDEEE